VEPTELFKAFGWAAYSARRALLRLLKRNEKSGSSREQTEKEILLLETISCHFKRLEAAGVEIPLSLEAIDKGGMVFLNENFLPFQRSALAALKRCIGNPRFHQRTSVDLVAKCKESLWANPILFHNFKAGVSKSWNQSIPKPEMEVVDSVFRALLQKVTHRSCGSWMRVVMEALTGTGRQGHLRDRLKHASSVSRQSKKRSKQ
jgi:hypothetical protein